LGKTGYITTRVEPKLKAAAGRVLSKVGVSTSDAITMFLRQIVLHRGMPFEVRAPNAETRRAIEQLESMGKRAKLKRHVTTEDMFAEVVGKRRAKTRRRA
jgi:DNA-damage-inducible protein J